MSGTKVRSHEVPTNSPQTVAAEVPDLEEIAARTAAPQTVPLPSGRTICIDIGAGGNGEALRVVGRNGAVELTIKLTDDGHKLVFDAADIELNAAEDLRLSCRNFQLEASGRADFTAADMRLEATAGDVQLHANDHVSLVGEQIRLNCDKPDEIPAWMEDEFGAKLTSTATKTAPTKAAPSLAPQRVLGDASLLERASASKRSSSESKSE